MHLHVRCAGGHRRSVVAGTPLQLGTTGRASASHAGGGVRTIPLCGNRMAAAHGREIRHICCRRRCRPNFGQHSNCAQGL